jgi:hypothetical protein
VLVGNGLPFSAAEWAPLRERYAPPVSSISSDFDSEGYEARLTANLARNWRFVANYSYTDSGRTNLAQEAIDFFGLKQADPVLLVQGVTQDAAGDFVVDPGAFHPEGAVAKWIELGRLRPGANPSVLSTSNSITVAQEIFDLVDLLNETREDQQKRWGVRPHKISLFTAYDFKSGRMEGVTIGGGWRWRSANVLGSNSRGEEITGETITSADLMLAYSRRIKGLPGRVRFQVNVTNLLDRTDIIPARLATSPAAPDGYQLPGGRGLGYVRYDLVEPRQIRFTTTYSF